MPTFYLPRLGRVFYYLVDPEGSVLFFYVQPAIDHNHESLSQIYCSPLLIFFRIPCYASLTHLFLYSFEWVHLSYFQLFYFLVLSYLQLLTPLIWYFIIQTDESSSLDTIYLGIDWCNQLQDTHFLPIAI